MQALRPLALSATLDLLFANPQWKDHLDAARVGGFGASLGGESLLLMAGAGLTSSVGLSWTHVENDARLKAAVGYVPYFGQPFVPAFGRDQHGLDDVTLPYLAIAGTADTTAPIASTAQGVQRLQGPRELVALTGVTHEFDVPSTNDIFTWALTLSRHARAAGRERGVAARADGRGGGRRRRPCRDRDRAAAVDQLQRIVVAITGGKRIGLGPERGAPGRCDLRDMVHL